jgi:glycosyltransferase involved in cell wall biosynthesis
MALTALRVRGPYRGASGHEHHVRELVRALHRRGVAIELLDLPEWGPVDLSPSQREPWFETLSRPTGASIALHFAMPHQVGPYPGLRNVNFTMFEATPAPAHWVAHNRRHDLLIVPTKSSRRAWLAGGMPSERIRLCPLGIDVGLYGRPITPAPLPLALPSGEPVTGRRVRFLNISEPGPRKNVAGLLRTWLCATTRHDDAVLIVKLRCSLPGLCEEVFNGLRRAQSELGVRLTDAAPIQFLFDRYTDAEMPRLYATATHYISLSFGEGWDLPMMEAAASGLQLIAPAHSAYTAYLNPDMAQLIPSREVAAEFPGEWGEALFGGSRWWAPDEKAAVAAIRAAIAGDWRPRAAARERVLRDFSWERAAQRLDEILCEL